MAYGLGVYVGNTEVLYSKPARYFLTSVKIKTDIGHGEVKTYTVPLVSALPSGTSVTMHPMDLNLVEHTLANENPSNGVLGVMRSIELNSARTSLTIEIEGVYVSEGMWGSYIAGGTYVIYSKRGSM